MAAVDPGPEKKLQELFTKLNGQIKDSQFKGCLKTVGDILEISPGDPDAVKSKVVALVQSSNFKDALSTIAGLDGELAPQLAFEKAYCLYRQGQLEEALEAVKSCPEDRKTDCLQLEAQLLYRLGRAEDCAACYERLQGEGSLESEVVTNMVASLISAGRSGEVAGLLEKLKVDPKDSFELQYNVACSLIGTTKYSEAEDTLQGALRDGKEELFDDDLTEAEVDEELAPIKTQLAYVRSLLGDTGALEEYTAILKGKPDDLPTVAVATNNLITARGAKDLFDANKRLDRLMLTPAAANTSFVDALESKLSKEQKKALLFNRCLVMLHANKLNACKDLLQKLTVLYPESDTAALIQAALLLREKKGTRADDLLERYVEGQAGGGSSVQLMRAQMAAAQGNWKRAIEAMEAAKLNHRPAVITTMLALYDSAGDIEGAKKLLTQSVQAYTAEHPKGEAYLESPLHSLHSIAAQFYAKHKLHENAADLYDRMVTSGDETAIAGLVHATSYVNVERAREHASRMPPVDGLDEVDIESLEAGGGLNVTSASRTKRRSGGDEDDDDEGVERAAETKPAGKDKKTKKRKPKLPKNFDPENPGPMPDPERWIPRQERSKFQKRSRRKDEVNVKGGQGVSASEAAKLEAKLEAKIKAPAEDVPEPAPKPAGKNSGKKGKKGRR